MTEKIMITGGAGFIGSNLTNYLLKNTDWNIKILDNQSNGSFKRIKQLKNYEEDRVKLVEGDIRNKETIRSSIGDCDYVVNLAAQVGVIPSIEDPVKDAEINIMGIINLLEASKDNKIQGFVHASSAAPLGETKMPIHEERLPQPLSPYGASKLAGEAYCSAYADSHELNTTALRFSNVYGPNSKHKQSVVHLFIKQILNKEQITIYGDGEQTRDYIHVKDICQGIHKALTQTQKGYELIQLGTGKETSVNQLYKQIKQGFKEKDYEVPEPVHEPERSGEIYRNYTDPSKAKETLNFEPKINLKQGLEETIEWYIKNL